MTMALIDAANDGDATAREVIENSLFDLGRKKPDLILSSCHSYLKKHSKVLFSCTCFCLIFKIVV